MIRKTFIFAAALSLAAALAVAQEKQAAKVTGFLLDSMCAGGHAHEAMAKDHETSCALMPGCARTGFAVVSKEKVYKLDEAGNKLALELLKNTKTKKGVSVTAEGTLDGDTLHADTLVEVR